MFFPVLDKEDGPIPVSGLLYAFGKKAKNILSPFAYEWGKKMRDGLM